MKISLPQIDQILKNPIFQNKNRKILKYISQQILEQKRNLALQNLPYEGDIFDEILKKYDEIVFQIKPIINATGIILHTNLGRSVISPEIFENVKNVICNYSNLEFDIKNLKRGDRFKSEILSIFFNCEDVLIVNNNAAAVFLILNTFAKNSEVIVSRSEIVEIGGGFRINEIMSQSGAILREVGTTNKTRILDFKNAINENTKILMKVERSNFEITGFFEEVNQKDIIKLAKDENLISYFDQGSGILGDVGEFDLVSFSGDKIIGGTQCGIICGKKELIKKLKQNQLLRILRPDKITIYLTNEIIKSHLQNNFIPTNFLQNLTLLQMKQNAKKITKNLDKSSFKIEENFTFLGGGSNPQKQIPTIIIKILKDKNGETNPEILKEIFIKNGVLGRICKENFILDLRAILPWNLKDLRKILKDLL